MMPDIREITRKKLQLIKVDLVLVMEVVDHGVMRDSLSRALGWIDDVVNEIDDQIEEDNLKEEDKEREDRP